MRPDYTGGVGSCAFTGEGPTAAMATMERRRSSATSAIRSELPTAEQRFLSVAIEYLLRHGLRTPDDFVAHFPPATIGRALANAPRLRVIVLEITAGLRREDAMAQPPGAAADILDRAFDEGDASPDILLGLIEPDARVRYLPRVDLWTFVRDHDAWGVHQRAHQRAADVARCTRFLLEQALAESMLMPHDIAEHIGASRLVHYLPVSMVGEMLERALQRGRRRGTFVNGELGAVLSPAMLIQHVPATLLLDEVLLPRLESRMLTPVGPTEAGAVAVALPAESAPIAIPLLDAPWPSHARGQDEHPSAS